MPPRVHRLDPAEVAAALVRQQDAVTEWLAGLPSDQRRSVSVSQLSAASADLEALVGVLRFARDLAELTTGNPPPYDDKALALVTRALVDLLANRAPGRSVELRVPPYAAVQCIEGPRHTRGKPASVVETNALTWLDLATGRITWAAAIASGQLRASGERSDLSAYLPLER